MKKGFVKLLCLLLGLNVFTACYGPGPRPEEEFLQKEQETLAVQDEEDPEAEAQPETQGEE